MVAAFQQTSFQTELGADSVPLREASYFSTHAQGLTKLSQLMSDPALLDVVTTALGIPAAFKGLDYDQQVAILAPRVDMAQFATAAGVGKFVDKYLAMDQLNQVTSGAAANPVLALFRSSNSNGSSDGSDGSQGLTLSAQTLNVFA